MKPRDPSVSLYVAGAFLALASCKSDCRGGVNASTTPIDVRVRDGAVGSDASCVGCTDSGAPPTLDFGAIGCTLERAGALTTPETKKAALHAGHSAAREKRWPAAAEAFCQAVVFDPADAEALGELGWAQLQSGNRDQAEAAIRFALTLSSSPRVHAALVYNLAKISVARSDGGGSVGKAISLSILAPINKPEDSCTLETSTVETSYNIVSCNPGQKNLLEKGTTFDDVRVLEFDYSKTPKGFTYSNGGQKCDTRQIVLHGTNRYYGGSRFYDSCEEGSSSDPQFYVGDLIVDSVIERPVVGESSSDLVIAWTKNPSSQTRAGYHTDSFMMVCTKSGEDAFCSDPIRYKVDDIPPPEELGGPGGPNDVPGFDLSYDFSPLGSVTFRVADGGSPLPPEARALLGVHPLQIAP